MTSLFLATESLPPVTWPQAFCVAVGGLVIVAFFGLLVTERWPWDRE